MTTLIVLLITNLLNPVSANWGEWVSQGAYDTRDREFIAALMDPRPTAASLTEERITECMTGRANPRCFRCADRDRDCFQGTNVQIKGKTPAQIRESGDYSACLGLQPGANLGMHQFACASRRAFEGGWVNVPSAEAREFLIEACRENGQVVLARFAQCAQNLTAGARSAIAAAVLDGSIRPRQVDGHAGAPELSAGVLAGIESRARQHCNGNTRCINEFKIMIRNFVNIAVEKSSQACANVVSSARESCIKLQASFFSTEFEQASSQFADATRFSRLLNFMAGACQEAGHNAGCMNGFPTSSLLPVDSNGDLPIRNNDGITTRISAMCRPPTVAADGLTTNTRACPQLEPLSRRLGLNPNPSPSASPVASPSPGPSVSPSPGPTPSGSPSPGPRGSAGGNNYVHPVWRACMAQTILCAGQCVATGRAGPACSADDVAVQSLGNNINDIVALGRLGGSELNMARRYTNKLRERAVMNLMGAFAQQFGTYDFLAEPNNPLTGQPFPGTTNEFSLTAQETEDLRACRENNPDVWRAVEAKKNVGNRLTEGDRAAFNITKTRDYDIQMARASADVMRNLYRANFPVGLVGTLYAGGPRAYVADPDCPCYYESSNPRERLSYRNYEVGRTAEGLFQYNGLSVRGDVGNIAQRCTADARCCGGVQTGLAAMNSPDSTVGRCAGFTDYPKATNHIAEHGEQEVSRTLQQFPILAAGGNPERMESLRDWSATSAGGAIPFVARFFHAMYPNPTDGRHDPRLLDRGTRPVPHEAVREIAEDARKAAAKDLRKTILNYCKGEQDGGPNWQTLVQMSGITGPVVAEGNREGLAWGTVQECAQKAIQSDATLKMAGTAVVGVGCLAVGIASAGTAAVPCAAAFLGLSAGRYMEARDRVFALGRCAGAGQMAGNCSAQDAVDASHEYSEAQFELALSGAFAAVDVATLGATALARRASAMARLTEARRAMAPADFAAIENDLRGIMNMPVAGRTQAQVANQRLSALEEASARAETLAADSRAARTQIESAARRSENDLAQTISRRYGVAADDPRLTRIAKQAKARQNASGAARMTAEEEAGLIDRVLGACRRPAAAF